MEASLCAKGCGFYGQPDQHGMCSQCYIQFLKENLITKAPAGTSVSRASIASVEDLTPLMGKLSTSEEERAVAGDTASECSQVIKPKRCKSCNKRVGLVGFSCRCGDTFCGTHRYPEEHSCKVDLKVIGRKALVKQNPQCVCDRLEYRV